MDPLSDVLRAMRLNGAYFYLVEAGGPWSILTEAARELVPRIMPEAEHLISYHILLSGTCWGGADGDEGGRRHRVPAWECEPDVERLGEPRENGARIDSAQAVSGNRANRPQ